MQRAKDYLLLSLLSYCNFTNNDYDKSLLDLCTNEIYEELHISSSFLGEADSKHLFVDFFKDVLDNWIIVYVDDKRASTGAIKDSTGFYGIVFKNILNDNYVIAYRGSERFPLEDAYKDFIETDLKIGLGVKPQQFFDGLNLFYSVFNGCNLSKENISITGHSLGGGIAQFVALMVDKEQGFVPYTCTWNPVGINRDGIINLLDFFDYEQLISKLNLTEDETQLFYDFKTDYLELLLKELKRKKIIKDNNTFLLSDKSNVPLTVDDELIKNIYKSPGFLNILNSISKESKYNLLKYNSVFYELFDFSNLVDYLYEANEFIKKIKDNNYYCDNILNFCHSGDLTVSLFNHLGSLFQIDKDFIQKKTLRKNIFSKLLVFTKSVQEYHYQDVFFPFIEIDGELKGKFSKQLAFGYLASVIRKLLTNEHYVDNELLVEYYSLTSINEENFLRIQTLLLNALNRCGDDILYKNQAYYQLKELGISEFSTVWEFTKNKLVSPYKLQDIYDLILFN